MIQYTQLEFDVPKSAAATTDYTFGWVNWLAVLRSPDTISTVAFGIAPILKLPEAPITGDCEIIATQPPISSDGACTSCWIRKGIVGRFYLVTCLITTVGGRTESKNARLLVVP